MSSDKGLIAVGANTTNPIWCLAFTPDDKQIVCGGQGEVGFFSYASGDLVKVKGLWQPGTKPQSALTIGFLPDSGNGGYVAVTGLFDGTLAIWNIATNKQIG